MQFHLFLPRVIRCRFVLPVIRFHQRIVILSEAKDLLFACRCSVKLSLGLPRRE